MRRLASGSVLLIRLTFLLLCLGLCLGPGGAQAAGRALPDRAGNRPAEQLSTVTPGEKAVAATVAREIDGQAYLDLILEGNPSAADLAAQGVIVETRLPNGMMTAEVPLARTRQVAALPGMRRITASYRASKCLDYSTGVTQARPNYWTESAPPVFDGLAGAGVVVGDVNNGIDFTHDDFRNPDGTSRILYLWDQVDTDVPHPSGYTYGREYTNGEINLGLPTVRDGLDGHGSHCMGIAAGDGSATGNGYPAHRYVGMAPRADLIIVVSDFSDAHIIDGVNYIFSQAAALGKSAVVNLSLASSYGPHLGLNAVDSALNALTGPGRIIVAAAGNTGGHAQHALQSVPGGGGDQTVTFSVPDYTPNLGTSNDFVLIDAYYDADADLTVSITSPRGTSNVTNVTKGTYQVITGAGNTDGAVYIENGYSPDPSGLQNIFIELVDHTSGANRPRTGSWTITLTPVSGTNPQLDLWMAQYQLGALGAQPVFTSDVDEHDTVGSPASAAEVIAVGAITDKTHWTSADGNTYSYQDTAAVGALTHWSAVGPLRDGTPKPDVAGFGGGIVSTLSSAVGNTTFNRQFWLPDEKHQIMSGTSMAAPHVTGAVALLLSQQPGLTPAQVKARLMADALVDVQTGAVWNYQYGNGKLRMKDAAAPVVAVTAPNGGEIWTAGSVQNITWTASDDIRVASVALEYSTDNGSSWNPVAAGLPNSGSFGWTVPPTATAQALVRAAAFDGAGHDGWDVSDADFEIQGSSTTVAEPLLGPQETLRVFPNPASPGEVRLAYRLARAGAVEIGIFDLAGHRLRRLASGPVSAGIHELRWDGRDAAGHPAGAGAYMVRLTSGSGHRTTRRLILVR